MFDTIESIRLPFILMKRSRLKCSRNHMKIKCSSNADPTRKLNLTVIILLTAKVSNFTKLMIVINMQSRYVRNRVASLIFSVHIIAVQNCLRQVSNYHSAYRTPYIFTRKCETALTDAKKIIFSNRVFSMPRWIFSSWVLYPQYYSWHDEIYRLIIVIIWLTYL